MNNLNKGTLDGDGPLYARIRQNLRRQILSGRLQPGDRLPTEKQLAESYGVSVLTVRQAQKGLVGAGLIAKQQGRGTYVADRGAANQRILLVCGLAHDAGPNPFSLSPYFQHTLHFCRERLSAAGMPLTTAWVANYVAPGMEEDPDPPDLDSYSGFIFLGCVDKHRLLRRARELGLNYVNLGKTSPGPQTIWYDPAKAMDLALDKIGDRSETVFAVVAPGTERCMERITDDTAGTIVPVHVPLSSGAWEYERRSYDIIRRVCAGSPDAAYIFMDDTLARGGTRALLEAGQQPAEVVVICGAQEVFPYGLPTSCVTHDTAMEASWAVAMLTKQLGGRGSPDECRESPYQLMTEAALEPTRDLVESLT